MKTIERKFSLVFLYLLKQLFSLLAVQLDLSKFIWRPWDRVVIALANK
jgi:hypothetical protein